MINYSNSKRLTDRILYGFCPISPKIILLRKIERPNPLSKSLVSSQKKSDGRCNQFLVFVSLLF